MINAFVDGRPVTFLGILRDERDNDLAVYREEGCGMCLHSTHPSRVVLKEGGDKP